MQILRLVLLVLIPLIAYLASANNEETANVQKSAPKDRQPEKAQPVQPQEQLEDLYLSDDFDINDLMNASRRNNDSRTHK